MNRYGNEFGYHNPKRTTALVKKLQAETGLQFTCSSWHNDTTDSLQIINVEDWKLYLGDRSDGTGYQLYYDVETETGDYSEAWSEEMDYYQLVGTLRTIKVTADSPILNNIINRFKATEA